MITNKVCEGLSVKVKPPALLPYIPFFLEIYCDLRLMPKKYFQKTFLRVSWTTLKIYLDNIKLNLSSSITHRNTPNIF